MDSISRRSFLALAASTPLALEAMHAVAESGAKTPSVCVFSKHLQFLDYTKLAQTCKDLGLDGVDLTVRAGGHVLPENVATDLPRAVEIIRTEGLEVPMITTNLESGTDQDARPILEAASKLGIPYFRIGGHSYRGKRSILAQLEQIGRELSSLAALAQEFGMTAGYHNHSGRNRVGAPLWDLHHLFQQVSSPNLGSNFDVGHATVEGAYGDWEITARLLAPHVKMMAVKDFVWEETKPKWVPLGEGYVDTVGFLKIFKEAEFSGPISLHFEYKVDGNDAMIEEIGRAVPVLKGYLKDAGYA
jgi:sugar phosphate isomerase/epimerase